MSKSSPQCADLKSIYVTQWFHAVLWGFVSGQRRQGYKVSEAIDDFVNYFAVHDVDRRTLSKIYERKNREYQVSSAAVSADVGRLVTDETDAEKCRLREQLRDMTLFLNQKMNEIDT